MGKFLIILLFISFNAFSCINEDEEPLSPIEVKNNQAVDLIKAGKSKQAVPILLAIEKLEPNRYQTATNLGTAYELIGNSTLARKWIARGIQLNPQSHNGTEWLHLAILDAKLKLQKEPNWLVTHSIFELQKIDNVKAIEDLEYQLSERTKFVKPKDDIVADMYYLLGVTYKKIDNVFYMGAFHKSIVYSDLRKNEISKLVNKSK
jgi:tetratricopeptide (TPR) repeat protein